MNNDRLIPIIEFQLNYLEDHIVQSMMIQNYDEFTKLLDEKVKQAISNYKFDEKITNIVHTVIDDSIEAYIKYGEGKKKIQDSINIQLDKLFFQKIEESKNENNKRIS
jgi:hypothetical protein